MTERKLAPPKTEEKLVGDARVYTAKGPALDTWTHDGYEYRLVERHGLYLIWNGKRQQLTDVGRDKAFALQCWKVEKETAAKAYTEQGVKMPIAPPNF